MNSTLEDRLRHHYVRVASELALEDLEFAEMSERAAVVSATRALEAKRGHRERRWIALVAASVLMVSGLGVLAIRRTERIVPATGSDESMPDGTPVAALCDDPRWSTGGMTEPAQPPVGAPEQVLLPADTPTGFCSTSALFDNPTTGAQFGGDRYTVWSSCADCDTPTAALALVRHGYGPNDVENPPLAFEEVELGGRVARWYAPASRGGVAKLATYDGGARPGFTLLGWGLTRDQFVAAAALYSEGSDVPSIAGMQLVWDDDLVRGDTQGGSWSAEITYAALGTSEEQRAMIRFAARRGEGSVSLLSRLWSYPGGRFVMIEGHDALVYEYEDDRYGRLAGVLIAFDDHTTVELLGWRVELADLVSIPVTGTMARDPRWALFAERG